MVELLDPKLQADVEKLFGSKLQSFSQNERLVLVVCASEHIIDHARVLEATDLHSRDCTLLLQRLVKHGFLVAQGKQGEHLCNGPTGVGSGGATYDSLYTETI